MRIAVQVLALTICGMTAVGTAQLPSELRVGYLPATHDSLLFIAIEEKLFPPRVRVVPTRYSNSGEILQKLEAGDLDLGIPGIAAPVRFIGAGSKLLIVGGAAKRSAALVVNANFKTSFSFIKSDQLSEPDKDRVFELLRGRRIGTVMQSTGDSIFRSEIIRRKMQKALVVQSKSSPTELLTELEARSLDAAVLWSPHMTRAEGMGMKIVLWTDQLMPDHICCRLVARSQFAAEQQSSLVGFLAGILRAADLFRTAPREKIIGHVNRYLVPQLPHADLVKELYGEPGGAPRTSLSPDIYSEGVANYVDGMQKADLVSPSAAKLVQQSVATNFLFEAYREAFPKMTGVEIDTCVKLGFDRCFKQAQKR